MPGPGAEHLADFLRQELELTGTHLGSSIAPAPHAPLLIHGKAARGFLVLAAQAHGKSIETIEGLSASGTIAALQAAFLARNAAQCGFCTSGMLLTAHELIASGRAVSRQDIRDYISGKFAAAPAITPSSTPSSPWRSPGMRKANSPRRITMASPTHAQETRQKSIGDGPGRAASSPRLLSGNGRYIDDIKLPRMLHLCFVRSTHPHARIKSIDVSRAVAAAGVAAAFTAADLNPMSKPLIGVALHRPGHRSPPQGLLADGRALWQGQPVVAVVAASRPKPKMPPRWSMSNGSRCPRSRNRSRH